MLLMKSIHVSKEGRLKPKGSISAKPFDTFIACHISLISDLMGNISNVVREGLLND